jgi:RimJ/RimL family protein N-acetyltransferase
VRGVVLASAVKRARSAGTTVILETDRLRLRTWAPSDAEAFDQTCNTAAVTRWLGDVQTRDELNDDVGYFIDCQRNYGHTFWVVERRDDEAFLGFCGFVIIPDKDSTVKGELEIGWRIRPDEWRKGYAEEAARACIEWAAHKFSVARFVSRTAQSNFPSQRLMRKLGMRHSHSLDYDPEDGSSGR